LAKIFVFIILFYIIYKIVKTVQQSKLEKNKNDQFKSSPPSGGEDLIEDPVCHTYVPLSQAYKKEISGKKYYFCSQQCSDKYVTEKNN
jgi:YHS domain-containing protein